MKKTIVLILTIIFSFSISVCAADYEIKWFDLQEDELIRSFEINHINEVQKDMTIKNYYKKDGKIIFVNGIINDSEVSYIAKIELM